MKKARLHSDILCRPANKDAEEEIESFGRDLIWKKARRITIFYVGRQIKTQRKKQRVLGVI
ncbi:hypothetical protein C3V36_00915 [Lachnospiraceae bacterium oral taxon 500]|nr:hypothetical protein C3V36_00915 [Lachnospiraceae bacterium oral taxon 500]